MLDWMQALKTTLRANWRTPWTSGLVILVLAVSVIGNAVMFGVVNALFLAPLPFDAPHELVDITEAAPSWGLDSIPVSYPDFVAWRDEQQQSFRALAAYRDGSMNHGRDDDARRMKVVKVTHEMAEVLGVTPVIGRDLATEDDAPGAPNVVLLVESTWRRFFGASPNIVGQTVSLDSASYEVVGVLPESARFLLNADAWIPLATSVHEFPDAWYLGAMGRLQDGSSIEHAQEELEVIHRALREVRAANKSTTPIVAPVRERFVSELRHGTTTLVGVVALVLVIACLNVSGLMLARARTRSREFEIRAALGASRGQLVRQILLESFTLSAIGTVVGAWAGHVALRAASTATPLELPTWVVFGIDTRFVVFSAILVVLTTLLSGLWPAVRVPRARTIGNRATSRHSGLLVTAEVALAVVLLVGCGLLIQSVRSIVEVDPGFRASGVLTYRLALPEATYADTDARVAFYERHLSDLSAIPGVESAGVTNTAPLGKHEGAFFDVESAPRDDDGRSAVLARTTSYGYYRAIGVRLLNGRLPEPHEDRAPVAVVNRTFARQSWPGDPFDDVLGARIRPSGGDASAPWLTVIGIVDDVRHYGLGADTRAGVYTPYGRAVGPAMTVVVRTARNPEAIVGPARSALARLDPLVPAHEVSTMEDRIDRSLWIRTRATDLSTLFAVYALLLAAAGVYGVVWHSVGARRREIGIRLALGAERADVTRNIFSRGMTPVAVGVGVGVLLSFVGRALVASYLFGTQTSQPTAYVAGATLAVLAASVAIGIPAYRAARTDITEILKAE